MNESLLVEKAAVYDCLEGSKENTVGSIFCTDSGKWEVGSGDPPLQCLMHSCEVASAAIRYGFHFKCLMHRYGPHCGFSMNKVLAADRTPNARMGIPQRGLL